MNSEPASVRFARLRWPLIALFIIWLAFCVSSFFVVNRPFDVTLGARIGNMLEGLAFSPPALGRALLDVGAAAWITIAAMGVGLQCWRWLSLDGHDGLATLLFASGIGFGALGLLTLILGVAGISARLPSLIILALLTVLTAPRLLTFLPDLPRNRPPRLLTLYLVLALGMVASLTLLPPTSWDALFYHLKGPKLYLQAGAIQPGIDIPHLNFPSLVEMLFLLAMQIRGDVSARLLHLVFALLLGGMVYLLARGTLKVKNAWLTLLFLFSTPLVLVLAAWAYNDLALAFYATAALYTFMRWDETNNDRWLVACGSLAGFLMGIKYTSVVIVIFLGIAILWRLRQQQKQDMKTFLYFLVPAVALVAPWLLKNWLFTGNPLYPFLFGGRFWDGFRAAGYSEAGSGLGLDPVALLRLPYDMTLGYADASQEGTIGPFYLLFLPLLLFYGFSGARKRTPRALRFLLLYALFSYLFWAFGVITSSALYQARLVLPGVVALCPVLAWIMEDLSRYDHPQFSLRRFLNLLLIFVVALLLLNQFASWLHINPIPYLSGTETRSTFLQRTLGPHYQIMETINRRLPSDAAVQFLWEPRSYYCDLDCRPDAILDRFDHTIFLYQDSESIADAWRADGLTHVLIFEAGLNFLLNAGADIDREILQSLTDDHMIAIDTPNNAYSLYRLQTDHE